MSFYLAGALTGRLFLCYLVVWLAMWLIVSRRDWRAAFRRTHRWYGLATIVVLFVAGLAVSVASRGGVA